MRVAIVYLGKRGGGAELVLALNQISQKSSILNILNSRYELKSELSELSSQKEFFLIPDSPLQLALNFRTKSYITRNIELLLKCHKIEKVLYVMPHPWDFSIRRRTSRIKNMRNYIFLHDHSPHPGDFWPFKRTIKALASNRHTKIIFSEYVGRELQKKYGKVMLETFELPTPLLIEERRARTGSHKKVISLVGRIDKKYKGVKDFVNLIFRSQIPQLVREKNWELLLQGTPIDFSSNINRTFDHASKNWLTHSELHFIIANSDVVVLPYVQASQSGIIPIALQYGTHIASTEIGGLTEQFEVGTHGLTFVRDESDSIVEALTKILKFPRFTPLRHGISEKALNKWQVFLDG